MSGQVSLTCPSAQPEMEQAQVLGVITREAARGPELAYANGTVPVTQDLLEATGEVPPTLVYRFAAPCAEEGCTHFADGQCRLASRIVEGLRAHVEKRPPCAIRKSCRWYRQEGERACARCPQVVTRMEDADPKMLEIAGMPG